MPNSMDKLIDKSVKLSVATKDNKDKSYVDDVQSAYIRQDKLLAKKLGESHEKMLADVKASFASKDEAAFASAMEKLSSLGKVLGEGTDEEASNYLSSLAEDKGEEKEDVKKDKAELSALSEQVSRIEAALENVLKGGNIVKFGEVAPTVDDEKVEKKLFDELKGIVDKLEKSHDKYGG